MSALRVTRPIATALVVLLMAALLLVNGQSSQGSGDVNHDGIKLQSSSKAYKIYVAGTKAGSHKVKLKGKTAKKFVVCYGEFNYYQCDRTVLIKGKAGKVLKLPKKWEAFIFGVYKANKKGKRTGNVIQEGFIPDV